MPSRKKAPGKNKGGRPRLKPKSGPQLIHEAREKMRLAKEAKQSTEYLEAEDVIAQMSDEEELKKLRDTDIKELRRQANVLWKLLQAERWENEQKTYGTTQELPKTDEEFLDQPAVQGQMTRKQWLEEHKHLEPKRKNARKVKSIRDIKEKDYEKYGLTTEVTETTDIDALERELENKLMDEAIAERKKERKLNPLLNRRQRLLNPQRPTTPQKNFWI